MNRASIPSLLLVLLNIGAWTVMANNRHGALDADVLRCYEDSYACMEPIQSYSMESAADIQRLLSSRRRLEQFSSDLDDVIRCSRAVGARPACADVGAGHVDHAVVLVSDYLSSPGAIDNLVAVSSSECFTNPSKGEEIDERGEQCNRPFENLVENERYCAAVQGMISCSETAAREVCGVAAGNFVQRVGDYILNLSPEQINWVLDFGEVDLSDCSAQAAIAKRFVTSPLFKR